MTATKELLYKSSSELEAIYESLVDEVTDAGFKAWLKSHGIALG